MRRLILGFVLLLTMGDSCNNNVVGVQTYGAVTGRVLDAMTNRPIADAIVSVGSLFVSTADAQGAFTIPHVPIGLQKITARMPGFSTVNLTVRVVKDENAQAGYLRLVPITKPQGVPTLPPPPTPTPTATSVPTWTPPGASASPSAAPSTTPAPTASASVQP